MVPAGARVRVDVEDGGSPRDLAATASRVRAAVAGAGGFVVTVGGDCGVELEPVAAAVRRHGDGLVVLWFDAHGDLNTPESSPSGAFHGMVLRALTGEGLAELVAEEVVAPGRVVLAGARDLDPAEAEFVASAGVRQLSVSDLADPAALVNAITSAGTADAGAEGGAVAVYVHIDLDVLDPAVFASVGSPAAGGLRPEQLLRLVTAVAERFEIAGLGITEYEPDGAQDHDLLVPLVESLVKVCAA